MLFTKYYCTRCEKPQPHTVINTVNEGDMTLLDVSCDECKNESFRVPIHKKERIPVDDEQQEAKLSKGSENDDPLNLYSI